MIKYSQSICASGVDFFSRLSKIRFFHNLQSSLLTRNYS